MFNKKGTEKPIEIFVALFVILAVALLLLQLFQSQLADQQQQLDETQREAQLEQLRSDADSHCQSQCSQASSDGCSLRAMANFCISYGSDAVDEPDYLDLNLDGTLNRDETLLVGTGVCEDEVPCHAMMSECCGYSLDANTCEDILDSYWDSQGYDESEKGCLVESLVRKGECGSDEPEDLWYHRAGFDDMAEQCEPNS